jgi:hypothetical protein
MEYGTQPLCKMYFLLKDNKEVVEEREDKKEITSKGKEKIEEVVDFIKNLDIRYLEKQQDDALRILEEVKTFPFCRHLLLVAKDVLCLNELNLPQEYFCLKVLEKTLERVGGKVKLGKELYKDIYDGTRETKHRELVEKKIKPLLYFSYLCFFV